MRKDFKKISFSSPLCLTLAGHDAAQYGKPALMMAADESVMVTLIDDGLHSIPEELQTIVEYIFPETQSFSLHISSRFHTPAFAVKAACIVATVGACLTHKNGKKPTAPELQKVSYELEQKILRNHSHAQTVACVQGGLIFYRKEFAFFKTVMQLPMKVPNTFLTHYTLTVPSQKRNSRYSKEFVDTQEAHVKKLVFAIQTEDQKSWDSILTTSQDTSDVHLAR